MKLPGPKTLASIGHLLEEAKSSETLTQLFERFDGVGANEAYHILSNLTDKEKRVLAVLIGKANEEFTRTKNT